MNVLVTLALLALRVVMGLNYDHSVQRHFEVFEHCQYTIVPFDQVNREDVVPYCISILADFSMFDFDEVCYSLSTMKDANDLHPARYGAFFIAANLIYDYTCDVSGDATTTPVTATTTTSKNAIAEPTNATSMTTSETMPNNNRVPRDSPKSPETCGKSKSLLRSSAGRIVGGRSAKDCSVIPWQVYLEIDVFMCGGSIISDRHILTAAHCLESASSLSLVKVTIAEHNLDKTDPYEETRDIKNMTIHKNYNAATLESDIAILTLKDPINFNNPCVAKICRDPKFKFDGLRCTVSGWGSLSYNGYGSGILQMVKVKTHKGKKCDRKFKISDPNYIPDKKKTVCAGHVRGGKDSCQGDSGGPLVCLNSRTNTFVQVGVVSYGKGCAEKGLPGVYTSVAYFNDWIDRIMAENSN